jgi:hypothetical protein
MRAPGTGLPGVTSLGTRRRPGIAAVCGQRPALVIEMTGAAFDRLIVTCADAAEAASARGRYQPSLRPSARPALIVFRGPARLRCSERQAGAP